MAKIIGILNSKEVYNENCNLSELESHCFNIVIEYGEKVIIKMYDDCGNEINGKL